MSKPTMTLTDARFKIMNTVFLDFIIDIGIDYDEANSNPEGYLAPFTNAHDFVGERIVCVNTFHGEEHATMIGFCVMFDDDQDYNMLKLELG